MTYKADEIKPQIKESLRGGNGTAEMKFFIHADDNAPHCGMAASVTLQPGCSIGEHEHITDAELYYIVSGKAMANDNGTMVELCAGDVMWTANGECHSIINHTQEPLVVLAVVVK